MQQVIVSIEGQDKLSGVLGNAAGSVSKFGHALSNLPSISGGATKAVGGFGSALGNMATVAGGIVSAQIFNRIADGISSFVSTGFSAVATAQTLQISLESLLAANNMYEQSVEQVTTATTTQTMSQAEYGQKLDELTSKLNVQKASMHEHEMVIQQLTAKYGENGLAVIEAKAKHEQMAVAIRGTQMDIDNLSASTTEYGTETRIAYKQVMSMENAQRQAAIQSKDLLAFTEKLAVISPFKEEQVAIVAKYAIAAGLGVQESKNFTAGFLDLAAAVGITSDNLGFAADQLLQVAKVGKLTEIDLRQLRRMGIDLSKIIGVEMGMSVDEFNAKAENSPEIFNDLFNAVTNFSKNTFGGTVERMSTSLEGLSSTLSDLFIVGARNLFRPLVEAASPAAAALIAGLSEFLMGEGGIKQIGQQMANIFKIFSNLGLEGGLKVLAQMFLNAWPDIQAALTTIGTNLLTAGMGFATQIAEGLRANWPQIQATLAIWRDNFFGWIAELYPQIPGFLTGLIQGINTFLADNWPAISATLMEWSTKFWDWVTTAAAQAGAALSALGVALLAWASSGETQATMTELGQNLATMITDYLKLQFEAGEGTSSAVVSLATGLLTAVGAVAGTLVLVGGQIVAGILSGVLKSIGVDLQPIMFSQLSDTLSGIATNVVTIASYIGEQIVTGIADALGVSQERVKEALLTLMTAGLSGVYEYLGIASASTVFFDIGLNMIQGLIDGIASMGGQLLTQMIELFGGLFGGGEGGGGASTLFDPATTTEAITTVQIQFQALNDFINTTLIAGTMVRLSETVLAVLGLFSTSLGLVLQAGVMPLNEGLVLMTTETLPNLQSMAVKVAQAIVAAFTVVLSIFNRITAAINTMIMALEHLGNIAKNIGDTIARSMEHAASGVEKLAQQARRAAEEFASMAEAAKSAATAARGLSGDSARAGAGGLGFQAGTSQLGFLVPPGYPNDSFPIRVQSGERVLVAPRGQSIEDLAGGRGTVINNYYQMTVNTNAGESAVVQGFGTLRAMTGG